MDTPELARQPESSETKSRRTDDKTIVTPYAFGVSEHLLNKPLATPIRRLFALFIDFVCIAFLSTLSATVLAGLAAIMFIRVNIRLARQKRFKRTRIALSCIVALLLFSIVYGFVSGINDNQADDEFDFDGSQAVVSAALYLAWSDCKDLECKRQVSTEFGEAFADTMIPSDNFSELVSKLTNSDETLPEFEQEMLAQESIDVFTRARQQKIDELVALQASPDESAEEKAIEIEESFSLLEWIKDTISDFGLGLGWAALYFSALPTYWQGATIGKRLLGIYVVRLDGRTPSLWENFGRYGGYGAGLATGFGGFLQVYWDPNRQAIQDKISETLVLRKQ